MSCFDFHSVFISFIRIIFRKFDLFEVHYFWRPINFKKIHIKVIIATFIYVRHFKTKWKTKDKKPKLQYNTKQNIEMCTYCSPQYSTQQVTLNLWSSKRNSALKWKQSFLPSAIIKKAPAQLPHKTACWHKELKDTEYRCLSWSATNISDLTISSWHPAWV